jgi:hypothetical protein
MAKVVRKIVNKALDKFERMSAWPGPIRSNLNFPSSHAVEMPWDNPEYDATPEVRDYFARQRLGEISVSNSAGPDATRAIDEQDRLQRVNELIDMYESDGDLTDLSGERVTHDSLVEHRDQLIRELQQ